MRIEYNFFTQANEMLKHIEEKIALEESRMTEEEHAVELDKKQEEAKKIIEFSKQLNQVIKYVPNEKKIQEFSNLYKKAIYFAKIMDCNIVVESDMKKYGKITLYTDNMLFQEFTPKEMLPIFIEMMKDADMAWYTVEKDVIQMKLEYKLADKLYMRSLL